MSYNFERLLSAAPSPFVLLDRDLRMVWANDAYLAVTGRTREAVIGRIMTEAFPSDPDSVHGRMLRASFKRVFETGQTDHLPLIPYPIERADGVVDDRYWSATHTPVAGPDGGTQFVLQNTHDVTALYRSAADPARPAQQADLLRRAEAVSLQNLELDATADFFRAVFSQAPSFMAITAGPDHVFRIANEAYLRLVGRRDLIGRPVRAALPEIEGQGFLDLLDQVYRSGEAVTLSGAAVSLRRSGGEGRDEHFVDFVYQPLCDGEGRITGIFVQGHDVTAQKLAERRLRETEQRFRTMAQTIPAHVWTAQPDGRIDWVSEQVFGFTGLGEEALLGEGWDGAIHPDDREAARAAWAAALRGGQAYETEFRIRRADGCYRWHLVRATPIRDEAGAVVRWVGTNADIDDQKATAEALADLNATLEERVARRNRELEDLHARLRQSQKMEAIGNLSGGVAHDFNNLLQAVTGSLTLAAREIAEASPAQERIEAAMGAVRRGASLASQLLAFSRQQPLEPEPLDPRALLAGMDHLIRTALGEEIELELEVEDGVWPVFADRSNLENAMLNLVVNARDAMEGRGQVRIAVANTSLPEPDPDGPAEAAPGDYVELCVIDTGGGMPAETIEKVFEPFFTTKPVGKGSGLGLATVYGFVRQSGGRVTIDSAPGQGTTVRLVLPRAAEAPAAPGQAVARRMVGGHERVLLVEDDPEVRDTSAALLRDLGYRVTTASSPDDALGLLASGLALDLVISDVMMPGSATSREVVQRIRAEQPEVRVLFISGYSRDGILQGGRVAPGIHFLSKPFTQERLAAKVRQVLGPAEAAEDAPGQTAGPAGEVEAGRPAGEGWAGRPVLAGETGPAVLAGETALPGGDGETGPAGEVEAGRPAGEDWAERPVLDEGWAGRPAGTGETALPGGEEETGPSVRAGQTGQPVRAGETGPPAGEGETARAPASSMPGGSRPGAAGDAPAVSGATGPGVPAGSGGRPAAPASEGGTVSAGGRPAPSVLICEDDALIRIDLAQILEEAGARVTAVGTCAAALAALKAERFDVLLTDVGLPDGSGEELARQARQIVPGLALIFATGQSEVAALKRLPGSVLLAKPFGEAQVSAALSAAAG